MLVRVTVFRKEGRYYLYSSLPGMGYPEIKRNAPLQEVIFLVEAQVYVGDGSIDRLHERIKKEARNRGINWIVNFGL